MDQSDTHDRGRLSRLSSLTDGQRDCLALVARHQTSKEIARLLGISKDTVDQRIASAVRKLGVASRAEAARIMIEAGKYDPLVYDPVPVALESGSGNSASSPDGYPLASDNRPNTLHSPAHTMQTGGSPWVDILPLTTNRDRPNTLSAQARLIWMLLIPVIIALLGLQLTAILDGLSRFYS